MLSSGRVDGLIIQQAFPNDPLCQTIVNYGIPTAYIAIDNTPHENAFTVSTDFAAGTCLALEHLLARGHTRIGHIHGDLHFAAAVDRVNAFHAFMQSRGLPVHPEWITGGGWSRQDGSSAAARILDQAEKPTAIVAANDILAIGAMEEIHRRGLRIPQDIAITGYDDIPLARGFGRSTHYHPHQFLPLWSQRRVQSCRVIRDPNFRAGQVQVPFKLIQRAST